MLFVKSEYVVLVTFVKNMLQPLYAKLIYRVYLLTNFITHEFESTGDIFLKSIIYIYIYIYIYLLQSRCNNNVRSY